MVSLRLPHLTFRNRHERRHSPLFKLDTSSESHPFYTGTQKSVDNMGGRVEKFRNRFGKTAAK